MDSNLNTKESRKEEPLVSKMTKCEADVCCTDSSLGGGCTDGQSATFEADQVLKLHPDVDAHP